MALASSGLPRRRPLQYLTAARRPRRAGQGCLACAGIVVAVLQGLCPQRFHSSISLGFVASGPRASADRAEEVAGASVIGLGRRSVLGAALLAGPMPAHAIFGIGESKPKANEYSIAGAFNISFPLEFEVLTETPEGLVLTGDKVQQLERMSAAAKVVSYPDLATGWGANMTEVGEKLAAKRPSGAAELVEAKADPTGAGLDVYQFEFRGDKLSELWLLAVVKRGSENVLCNVACRTPAALWDSKKDQFLSILESFKPIAAANETKPTAVEAPAPEPVAAPVPEPAPVTAAP